MSYLFSKLSEDALVELLPEYHAWPESLRFYCQTSSPNDPSLEFMASMWSYAIYNGSLTGKQAESAHKYLTARYKELPDWIQKEAWSRPHKEEM